MDVLSFDSIRKSFNSVTVLSDVTFSLRAGECLALLGPNGAGKSTLVRSISGRVELDSGRVYFAESESGAASIGIVPQEIALYEKLSATENLHVFGSLHGVDSRDIRDRIAWALSWSGLTDRANDLVETFSGGMQRRLNVVCGLMHRPRILILDEPTVGVDPQSRDHLWRMLEELRNEETSILLTTHQLDEAQEVCDRIIIMDHGQVIAEGTFQELLRTTVGTRCQVACHVSGPLQAGKTIPNFTMTSDNCLVTSVDNVAKDLPARLAELHENGIELADLTVHQPDLQAVFLHLTGRELRE